MVRMLSRLLLVAFVLISAPARAGVKEKVAAHTPQDSNYEGTASLTLSTWGLSEKEFFEVTSDWLGWWQGLLEGGEAVV